MGLEELGHAECADLVLAEDGLHRLVGDKVLLVLGVLELLLLEVGPDPLDDLGPGELLALLGSNDGGELGAQSQGLGQSGSLGGAVRRSSEGNWDGKAVFVLKPAFSGE